MAFLRGLLAYIRAIYDLRIKISVYFKDQFICSCWMILCPSPRGEKIQAGVGYSYTEIFMHKPIHRITEYLPHNN